jgi:hypothetical protein
MQFSIVKRVRVSAHCSPDNFTINRIGEPKKKKQDYEKTGRLRACRSRPRRDGEPLA